MCTDPPPLFMPDDPALPFFAYGLFMPGELAFFQIAPHVQFAELSEVPGLVRARDGVPVLDIGEQNATSRGWRIEFAQEHAVDGYSAIGAMEPRTQYRWAVHAGMNVLAGISPRKGSDLDFRQDLWSSLRDPAFHEALSSVQRLVLMADETWEGFFQVQAAWLLLWSSIERYVSLRYGLGRNDKVMERINKLAGEAPFIEAVAATHVEALPFRRIYRSDDPSNHAVFDPADPKKALNYLYQVRSNAAHRGKNPMPDGDLLRAATTELLRITRATLLGAGREARQYEVRWQGAT